MTFSVTMNVKNLLRYKVSMSLRPRNQSLDQPIGVEPDLDANAAVCTLPLRRELGHNRLSVMDRHSLSFAGGVGKGKREKEKPAYVEMMVYLQPRYLRVPGPS
jgi:hypothetical protein